MYTRRVSTLWRAITCFVMPAMSEGSPSSRRWSRGRNQFQQRE